MYKIIPRESVVPNVFFLHGDIAEIKIFSNNRLLFTTELRVKDTVSTEDLPRDDRRYLYLDDEWCTVDDRVWPVTRREYPDLTWQLVRPMSDQSTLKRPAGQALVV